MQNKVMEVSTSELPNNRHIIDDALNTLATALSAFIANKIGVAVHDDVATLIRVMLSRWDAGFHSELGYRGKNLVFEVRDIRNDWAHNNKPFDDDDTDRALDSIERFLAAIGAASEAAKVNRTKEERRRARYVSAPLLPTQRCLDKRWPKSISIRRNLIGRGQIRQFEFNGVRYEVPHDELVRIVGEVTPWLHSSSWLDRGGYSTSNPSAALLSRLLPFALNFSG